MEPISSVLENNILSCDFISHTASLALPCGTQLGPFANAMEQ